MVSASAMPVMLMSRPKMSWSDSAVSMRTWLCWHRCSILGVESGNAVLQIRDQEV